MTDRKYTAGAVALAARLFRECGLSGIGVDALTDAAGLTHGSLYSQFGSKERPPPRASSFQMNRLAPVGIRHPNS